MSSTMMCATREVCGGGKCRQQYAAGKALPLLNIGETLTHNMHVYMMFIVCPLEPEHLPAVLRRAEPRSPLT
ncbi:hypothetical protein E2C01_041564 [Portunus trituberculatus]|uniref:Uncharacterized protein n=1 Tax=Portunus trituberculatus TaxID=210409 RepID=A0A5B7FR23_PORTR|nr:hypothetical protein [Portunus trituberculatus]